MELITRRKITTISLPPNINSIMPEGVKLSNKPDFCIKHELSLKHYYSGTAGSCTPLSIVSAGMRQILCSELSSTSELYWLYIMQILFNLLPMILPKNINSPIQVGKSCNNGVRGGDLFLTRCKTTQNDRLFHQISCHKTPDSEVMKSFPFFI